MRRSAFLVGCWCGSLQLTMIYGLSFLWSATPQTSLWVLLGWLSGSVLGVHHNPSRLSPWRWIAPPLLMLVGFHIGAPTWQIVIFSSFLSGMLAGHWLTSIETYFITGLRWETLGLGTGFLTVGGLAFHGLNAMEGWCLLVAGLTCWKEHNWRNQGLQGFP